MFPPRYQFDEGTRQAINDCLDWYAHDQKDFSPHGHFKKIYQQEFCRYLSNDKAEAEFVNSGTNAAYLALKALELPQGSEIIVSPITDAGMIAPIIQLQCRLKICDSQEGHYNVSLNTLRDRVNDNTRALFLAHIGGHPINDIQLIRDFCLERQIYLIEDGSQAHGAEINGQKIGTFGDLSIFSTGFSKNHSSGSTGGLIYSKNTQLMKNVRIAADRGKDFTSSNFNPKDPNTFQSAELNFNTCDLSAAIGIHRLQQLDIINKKRRDFIDLLQSSYTNPHFQFLSTHHTPAPFFLVLNLKKPKAHKLNLVHQLKADGVPHNPHYSYLVHQWHWVRPYLVDDFIPTNALLTRDSSIHLMINERYGAEQANVIIGTLKQVFDNL